MNGNVDGEATEVEKVESGQDVDSYANGVNTAHYLEGVQREVVKDASEEQELRVVKYQMQQRRHSIQQ